jgi:hypothetical protein
MPRDIVELTKGWLKQRVIAVTAKLDGSPGAAVLLDSETEKVLKMIVSKAPMYIGDEGKKTPFVIDRRYSLHFFEDNVSYCTAERPFACAKRLDWLVGVVDRYALAGTKSYSRNELCQIQSSAVTSIDFPFEDNQSLSDLREENGEKLWVVEAGRHDNSLSWGLPEGMMKTDGANGLLCLVEGRVCCVSFYGPSVYIYDRRAAGPTTLSDSADPYPFSESHGRDREHLWWFKDQTLKEFDWRAARYRKRLHIPFVKKLTGFAAEFWI